MMPSKHTLRKAIRLKSAEVDPASRLVASQAVFEHVLDFIDERIESFRALGVIGFASLSDEVDTAQFMLALKERGLKYHVTPNSTSELEEDVFSWLPRLEKKNDLLLLIVPGVAFDLKGTRIGRGKGYYDRMLATLRREGYQFISIGVGYDHQVVDEVPKEAHDQPVDFVCTPSRGLQTPLRGLQTHLGG